VGRHELGGAAGGVPQGGAVIDRGAYNDIKGYIDHARSSPDGEVLVGGECDDSKGYFIRPTLVQAKRPDFKLMQA